MSRNRFVVFSVVVDALLANAGFVLAFLIRFGGQLPLYNFKAYLILAPVITLLFVSAAWIYGLYDPERSDTAWAVARGALMAVTVATLLTAVIAFFGSTRTAAFARSTILIAWALDLLLFAGWRLLFLRLGSIKWPEQRVLIVGTDRASLWLAEKVAERERWGWKVSGLIDECVEPRHPAPKQVGDFPVLGNVDEIAQVASHHHVNRLIIASPIAFRELVESLVLANETKMRIDVVPDLYEVFIGTVDAIVGDVPLMEISRVTVPRYYAYLKRFTDVVSAVVLLLLTSPLLILASVAIAIQDGFPLFFSQERVGRDLKPFRVHKLRTMIRSAEDTTGPVLAQEEDDRVTTVGRFLRRSHIDELPQLINIARGEMSFVGPRPERPFFVEQYLRDVPGYRERFTVRPGLTGLAQVSGYYATTPDRKLKYDLIYIYHQSPLMDVRIVVETLQVVFLGRGAR